MTFNPDDIDMQAEERDTFEVPTPAQEAKISKEKLAKHVALEKEAAEKQKKPPRPWRPPWCPP